MHGPSELCDVDDSDGSLSEAQSGLDHVEFPSTQEAWTSDPPVPESSQIPMSLTPEQWDDGVMEQIGAHLVLQQTHSLCVSHAQTDVRVQILQSELGSIANQAEVVAQDTARNFNKVGGMIRRVESTLENMEAERKKDMLWIKVAVSNLLQKHWSTSQSQPPILLNTEATSELEDGIDLALNEICDEPGTSSGDKSKGKGSKKIPEQSKTFPVKKVEALQRDERRVFESHSNKEVFMARKRGVCGFLNSRAHTSLGFFTALVLVVIFSGSTCLLQYLKGSTSFSSAPTGEEEYEKHPTHIGRHSEIWKSVTSTMQVTREDVSDAQMDVSPEETLQKATIEATGTILAHEPIQIVTKEPAPSNHLLTNNVSELTARAWELKADLKQEVANGVIIKGFQKHLGYPHLNAKDDRNRTLLHRATYLGRTKIAQALLQCQDFTELLTTTSHGLTALHYAAATGSVEIVEMLLDLQAFTKVNAVDFDDLTALHHAASKGHAEVINALLQSPRFSKVNSMDQHGLTALQLAARRGHLEAVKALLRSSRFKQVDHRDHTGKTALHFAAMDGHIDVVSVIMNHASFTEVNARSHKDWSALEYGVSSGNAALVRTILDNPRFTAVNAIDAVGWTALHHAAFYGFTRIVDLLLTHRSFTELNTKHDKGCTCTALHVAAQHGHRETLEVLLKQEQLEVNAKDRNGWTALHFSASNGHISCAEVLLRDQRFTEIFAKDKDGMTAMDVAEQQGYAAFADRIHQHLSELKEAAEFVSIGSAVGNAVRRLSATILNLCT